MDRETILTFAKLIESPVEKERSRNVMLMCPFEHTHSKRGKSPTLSVKVDPGRVSSAHCFSCEVGGSLTYVFAEAHKAFGGLESALRFLAEYDRGDFMAALSANRLAQPGRAQAGSPTFFLERYVAKCSRFVPAYLVEQRGIVRADVERWRLGFDAERQRAVFPVWDDHQTLVGTTGRSVLPDGVDPPRYKDWPPSFAQIKTNYFYGEHLVDPTLEQVYLCEGPLSAIYAARVLSNVLGMFGASTGVTDARLAKLKRWARKVTIIFDGDQAGRDAVFGKVDPHGKFHEGLRDILRRHFVVNVAALPEGQDPASIPSSALLEAVRGARYVF